MPSTYSDLKVELISTGEQSGSWGDTTNTNLGTALEEAIVGRANANFPSDADLTITLTNTNATQVARNYILNVTSSVSLSTTRNLIVPTIDKPYIVENNTTGGQSIVVKTSAGTGVTVPNGKTVMVYANSTNVVAALDYIPSLTLGSAMPVSSGGTGVSSLTANGYLKGNGTSAITSQTGIPASDITSGTLSVARGGTGQTSYTDGQLLIGNSSGNTLTKATLTAGSNITITNGNGSITIASTASSGGDVSGPASSVNNNIVVFDGVTGKLIKDGGKGLPTGDIVGTTDTQTISSKTLVAPVALASTTTTQDGVILTGRAGGTNSFRVTIVPTTLSQNRTLTLPNVTGTAVLDVATQTLTNKTIEAGTFTNGYTEETVSANTGTAYTIDLLNGSLQILTLTGNCTFTFPTATAGRGFTLILEQDATGSRTVTWPASVKWPSNTAPTITATALKADKYVFVADGTNWIGSNAGQNYTV